jgi:hypothetical protein
MGHLPPQNPLHFRNRPGPTDTCYDGILAAAHSGASNGGRNREILRRRPCPTMFTKRVGAGVRRHGAVFVVARGDNVPGSKNYVLQDHAGFPGVRVRQVQARFTVWQAEAR